MGRRLVAGIALYGLILHTFLFAFHAPALLADPALDPHALCLAGGSDPADQEPAKKHPDNFCPICVRLAGLHLAPPPQAIVLAVVAPRSIVLLGESDRSVAARPPVRPHSRGPPVLAA